MCAVFTRALPRPRVVQNMQGWSGVSASRPNFLTPDTFPVSRLTSRMPRAARLSRARFLQRLPERCGFFRALRWAGLTKRFPRQAAAVAPTMWRTTRFFPKPRRFAREGSLPCAQPGLLRRFIRRSSALPAHSKHADFRAVPLAAISDCTSSAHPFRRKCRRSHRRYVPLLHRRAHLHPPPPSPRPQMCQATRIEC